MRVCPKDSHFSLDERKCMSKLFDDPRVAYQTPQHHVSVLLKMRESFGETRLGVYIDRRHYIP